MERVRNLAGKRKHSGADSDITTKILRTEANPSCDNEPIESLEVDPAESPSIEIKAVRFKIDAVEIKINAVEIKVDAVEIKVDAVDICLRGDSEEIANSTNVQVLTYKLLTEAQLQEEKRQLQEEKRQLREEKNKLQEKENKLLEKENILLTSKGTTSYLAFLESLLLLTLASCWISLRPSPLIWN